jgi:hypothetical protein
MINSLSDLFNDAAHRLFTNYQLQYDDLVSFCKSNKTAIQITEI